jgi:hypothetical protein
MTEIWTHTSNGYNQKRIIHVRTCKSFWSLHARNPISPNVIVDIVVMILWSYVVHFIQLRTQTSGINISIYGDDEHN